MKMIDTKIKGNLTELECITAFARLGAAVSIPFGEDCRYDFIADINGRLLRIQCKTSHPIFEDGDIVAIGFSTVRQSGNRASNHKRIKYTDDEIDFFATAYDGECYIVPVNECSNEKRLRFKINKNQVKNINFANDYRLQEVLNQM